MIGQRALFGCLFLGVVSVIAAGPSATAGEYVWARTSWGSLPMGNTAGSMTNGYGGYYVPKNAYGNNYESRRPFTNPTGFIIPAEATPCPPTPQAAAPVAPTQPSQIASGQRTQVTPVQPMQGQACPQPWRLTRIAPVRNK